jgi:putative chitinase
MKCDRKRFFDSYRAAFGKIQRLQVDGLEFLLGKIESDPEWKSLPQLAYFLATIKHETGIYRVQDGQRVYQAFQPIKELRGRVGTKIRTIQDKYWDTGAYGRGYVQITWPENYKKFGIGSAEYDKALEPDTAYMIAARGMREGKFTKYKLSHFVNGQVDYREARRVVNGLDKADEIADIAEQFEEILKASLVTDTVTDPEPIEPEPEKPVPQVNVEHADTVEAPPLAPVPGGHKDDRPAQASQGSKKSVIATVLGALTGIGTALKGWLDGNNMLAVVGVICITVLLLVFMFRQFILDWLRMKYMADPSKINVK